MAMQDVDGLPDAVKSATERGSVGRVLLGPGGLSSGAAREDGSVLWVIAWDGQRWQAKTGASIAEVPGGTWVGLLRAGDGGRSAPHFLRWPQPGAVIGTPVVLTP